MTSSTCNNQHPAGQIARSSVEAWGSRGERRVSHTHEMRRPSLAFVCALTGVALTLLSWYGPWAWPAWPAFAAMDAAFGSRTNFADLSYRTKSIAIVVLIALNVAAWAVATRAIVAAVRATRSWWTRYPRHVR
jgi:hypothetical protein